MCEHDPAKRATPQARLPAPGKDGTGGEGEAVVGSSRHSDDVLPSQGLDLLGQQLLLLVAVAQTAKVSTAPAPDSSVGGEGEAVADPSGHSDDALPSQGLDLLGQQLVLLIAVAQPAMDTIAPAPDSAVGGESEAVVDSSRDSDNVMASQGLDHLRQQLLLLIAVA